MTTVTTTPDQACLPVSPVAAYVGANLATIFVPRDKMKTLANVELLIKTGEWG